MKFENNIEWYEKMANSIISSFWDIKKFKIKNKRNISAIFLAWAPWAGKTEFLDTIFTSLKNNFIVIDIDKYRKLFKWYNWDNANEFQNSSVKVANKILKFCFKNNLNFIFDWTFRNYNKVKENFWQCQKYWRNTIINLIYQEPRISFFYTFLRKLEKKRNVPIDVFIDWFYDSIENVFRVIKDFNNSTLIIAYKKYSILNKDKSFFKIEYNNKNITYFCKKNNISYKKWKFENREKLKFDINNYNNILLKEKLWKWSLLLKIKLWTIEKFFKSF